LNCKGVIRELNSYLDGELSAAAKQDLEEHLEDCTDCKLIVNQTKLTVDIFCDSQHVELPQDVRDRLHEALRRRMRTPRTGV
jgi:anti-sigma factor RsiW